MATGAPIPMPTDALPHEALLTLTQWLSPGYPVGAFSYSHGLEWAVEVGDVRSASDLSDWLSSVLEHGAGLSDAMLLTAAHRADDDPALAEVAELAEALAPSAERALETLKQGAAFARTTRDVWGMDLPDMAYPVAVGRAARLQGIPLRPTATLYLHSLAANLVSAGIRLVPLGQTEGQTCLSRLTPLCQRVAQEAIARPLDLIASSCVLADIASMKHETQYSRIFRS